MPTRSHCYQYMLFPYRKVIADLALKWRLPTVYHGSDWVVAGGLCRMPPTISRRYGRVHTTLIGSLKGAKPRDLPVEQPTKFRLVINQKTARALDLFIPLDWLAMRRGDRITVVVLHLFTPALARTRRADAHQQRRMTEVEAVSTSKMTTT